MKVKVLFFAQLRETFGETERWVQVKESFTVGDLVHLLMTEISYSRFEKPPFSFAVNENFAVPTRKLEDQDIVALLPPVAGG